MGISFSWVLVNTLAACLLPPLNGLLLAASGCLLHRFWPRLGRCLFVGGGLLLLFLSLPVVAQWLLKPLEQRHPPLDGNGLTHLQVDALVVLGGGRYRMAPEFSGHDDVSAPTLERLRYAAVLSRALGKPLLVSGGRPEGGAVSEAETMRNVLRRDFNVEVRWLEEHSGDTWESAHNTAPVLLAQGGSRIALVTHAWHMPRSVAAFEAAGLSVVPAPMAYVSVRPLTPLDFIPQARAMNASSVALHEWIGMVWYAFR